MKPQSDSAPTVAVCIPCYNEAIAIGKVIQDFRHALPSADIYVLDNNSTDDTVTIAQQWGAEAIRVPLQGKGNTVRRAFSDIEADIYLLVDGDGTYDASAAPLMIDKLIHQHLDMVVGCRTEEGAGDAATYRKGHRIGNRLLTGLLARLFGGNFTDVLSGYRALSRRFVKSFPALASGFETETELTVHALELRMPYGEMATRYGSRPEGSVSKLSTYKDGLKILKTMIRLYAAERPLTFYFLIAGACLLLALILFIPVGIEYLHTGLVPRLPTAVLCTGLAVCGLLSASCGTILDQVTRARHETKRLHYLSISRWKPPR